MIRVPILLAQQPVDAPAPPRVAELDPATRATLLLALLAIIVAGVGLILLVILGAHMVRRWARFSTPTRPKPQPRPHVPIDLSTLFNDPPADTPGD